jgi:V8-like Glu-specific endopeptidase
MSLNIELRKSFLKALLSAYDLSGFARMLLLCTNRKLEDYADRTAVRQEQFLQVITAAERGGWVDDLVRGAHAEQSCNPEIEAFFEAYLAEGGANANVVVLPAEVTTPEVAPNTSSGIQDQTGRTRKAVQAHDQPRPRGSAAPRAGQRLLQRLPVYIPWFLLATALGFGLLLVPWYSGDKQTKPQEVVVPLESKGSPVTKGTIKINPPNVASTSTRSKRPAGGASKRLLSLDKIEVSDKSRSPSIAMLKAHFPGRRDICLLGTGTLIGPRVVLTAGHMLFNPEMGGFAEAVDVIFPSGTSITVKAHQMRTTRQWIAIDSHSYPLVSSFDIGCVVLPAPVDHFVQPMHFDCADDTTLRASPCTVAGYPLRMPIGDLFGCTTSLSRLTGSHLFYPVATENGMSGSPVYTIDRHSGIRTLRGVHTAKAHVDGYGVVIRITEPIYQMICSWLNANMP